MTLWSKDDERFIILLTSILPSITTALSIALWTQNTDFRFIDNRCCSNPPSLPRLVIVNVEPDKSSADAVPSLVATTTLIISLAAFQISMASTCLTTGTYNPLSVWVAIPKWTPSNCLCVFLSSS